MRPYSPDVPGTYVQGPFIKGLVLSLGNGIEATSSKRRRISKEWSSTCTRQASIDTRWFRYVREAVPRARLAFLYRARLREL